MLALLAVAVDVLHALAMVAWVAGLPLLFWHRSPRLSRAYAIYALAFVVLNQVSQWVLGECFLTTLARWLWESAAPGSAPANVGEWFTVRFAQAVFRMSPSHRSIAWISEGLVVLSAAGMLHTVRKMRIERRAWFH